MDTLLLAAGLGTRLKPLTDVLPKCLMPIHGKPLLGIWLNMMKNAGVRSVFLNLHYKADMVRSYVEQSPYSDFVTFIEEEQLLGTAGTLRCNQQLFTSDKLLIAHADNLTLFDTKRFEKAFDQRPAHALLTLMTFDTDMPSQCGIVRLNEQGIVTKFTEKPKEDMGTLANGAIYLMQTKTLKKFFEQNPTTTDFSTEVLPYFVGEMNTFHNAVYHRDIGNLFSYSQAQQDMLNLPEAQDFLKPVSSFWSNDLERKKLAVDFDICMRQSDLDPKIKELALKT